MVEQEEHWKSHLIKILSVSHCLWMAQQTFAYQTLTLFNFLWITLLPLEISDPYLLLMLKFGLCALAWNWIWRQSLGEVEKNTLIALPGKGGHSRLMPSKLCVPTWEDLVRSFIAMVQGQGCWQGLWCVQGLQSFNLASGGLLMSFYASQGYQTVTFSLEWRMLHQVVNIFHLLGILVL